MRLARPLTKSLACARIPACSLVRCKGPSPPSSEGAADTPSSPALPRQPLSRAPARDASVRPPPVKQPEWWA